MQVKLWVTLFCSLLSGCLTDIAVEFRGEAHKDAINYGHLPYMADLPTRTMAAWITPNDSGVYVNIDIIAGMFSDNSSFTMYYGTSNHNLRFIQKFAAGGSQGVWESPANSVPYDTLKHVLVIKDLSSDSDPVMYINGSSVTVTEVSTPTAGKTAYTDDGVPFIIGNAKTATIDYAYGFDGQIQDVRVYGRALTSSEITELYNSGSPDSSVGTNEDMLFQGPVVRTSRYAEYEDQILTSSTNVIDNMFGVVGFANDAPTGRTPD